MDGYGAVPMIGMGQILSMLSRLPPEVVGILGALVRDLLDEDDDERKRQAAWAARVKAQRFLARKLHDRTVK